MTNWAHPVSQISDLPPFNQSSSKAWALAMPSSHTLGVTTQVGDTIDRVFRTFEEFMGCWVVERWNELSNHWSCGSRTTLFRLDTTAGAKWAALISWRDRFVSSRGRSPYAAGPHHPKPRVVELSHWPTSTSLPTELAEIPSLSDQDPK